MRTNLLFVVLAGLFLAWAASAQAQCPEDTLDSGICDTLDIEVYECDWLFSGGPKQVRVPMRVTHDVPDPQIDSLVGFQIPLCFTSSNPSAQCVLDPYYNSSSLTPSPVDRSIFRHLPDMETATEHNWMMDLAAQGTALEWDFTVLNLEDQHFWWVVLAQGREDQNFWEGSRVLLATMTFTVDDTTTICLDSCFWPPANRLVFARDDAAIYFPRTNLPYCFSISDPVLGDCNADHMADIGDLVYLISYLFRNGDPPIPLQAGDTNCDGTVDIGDVVRLIGYLYKGEPSLSC
ncbi:MAG: dockerin type I repeat-containing protein [Candidatus Zixiibacteriota bacterium]|nr:MAG: dockerin type I repeat-containing protein [candidate division Zixibacteria bacterium]